VVEVVGITLVLVLEFVKKVEEIERERRGGAERRGGKPIGTEKLNLVGDRVVGTVAIPYDDTMNAVQLKDHVIV